MSALSASRGNILAFQSIMEELVAEGAPVPYCPLEHTFAPGNYARKITLPKGAVVVGKIHKHGHLNFIMSGRVTVVTPEGREDFNAPHYFVSVPGTKRVVYAHEDTVWITVHPTNETDLASIEEDVIAKDFNALGLDSMEVLT